MPVKQPVEIGQFYRGWKLPYVRKVLRLDNKVVYSKAAKAPTFLECLTCE